jgi:hypothetical protein
MERFVEMLGRVLVLGRIATAYVSTREAKTQVDPGIAGLGTVFTHMLVGFSDFDLIKVGAFFRHRFLLCLRMNVSQDPCSQLLRIHQEIRTFVTRPSLCDQGSQITEGALAADSE